MRTIKRDIQIIWTAIQCIFQLWEGARDLSIVNPQHRPRLRLPGGHFSTLPYKIQWHLLNSYAPREEQDEKRPLEFRLHADKKSVSYTKPFRNIQQLYSWSTIEFGACLERYRCLIEVWAKVFDWKVNLYQGMIQLVHFLVEERQCYWKNLVLQCNIVLLLYIVYDKIINKYECDFDQFATHRWPCSMTFKWYKWRKFPVSKVYLNINTKVIEKKSYTSMIFASFFLRHCETPFVITNLFHCQRLFVYERENPSTQSTFSTHQLKRTQIINYLQSNRTIKMNFQSVFFYNVFK